jgi:HD-GYP domain-containing protein (c-di-GMP phosphodiesterase class II)
MIISRSVSLLNFVISIANAVDHIDARISNHHKRVAYIASQIACVMHATQKSQYDLMLAGLLHDIGTLSIGEHIGLLNYDDSAASHHHCEVGFQLLNKFRHFFKVSTIIRHHHTQFIQYRESAMAPSIPMESLLLYMADRVDSLIDNRQPILEQVDHIVATIARDAGTRFNPEHVDAFSELAWREEFWLDVASPSLEKVLLNNCRNYSVEMDDDDLLDFAELFAHIIDFRSPFTATHSSGVASTASVLANLVGFSESECQKIKTAGYLHDIGKLAIPINILEKNGKLTSTEFRTIKSHAYYTNRILEPLQGMDEIRIWAAMHHERLDGNGYPGRSPSISIPLGSRIIAVADVFTALLESRPYRSPLTKKEVQNKLMDLVSHNALDRKVVKILLANFDAIDIYRGYAQEEARKEYLLFRKAITQEVDDTPILQKEFPISLIPSPDF